MFLTFTLAPTGNKFNLQNGSDKPLISVPFSP